MRHKTSNVQKMAKGTFRLDREIPEQPVVETMLLERPHWLPADAAAHWDDLMERLGELGVELRPADQDALAAYCVIYAQFMANPAEVTSGMLTNMRAIWERFGMTNGARQTLGIKSKPAGSVNPFTQI